MRVLFTLSCRRERVRLSGRAEGSLLLSDEEPVVSEVESIRIPPAPALAGSDRRESRDLSGYPPRIGISGFGSPVGSAGLLNCLTP